MSFKVFLKDYKFFVSACESNPDMFILRDRLLNKRTLFAILILSDVYCLLSRISKCVQSGENLPWEYFRNMQSLESHLEIMLSYVDLLAHMKTVDDVLKNVKLLPSDFFKFLKTADEMLEFSTYQGIPLPDTPVSSKSLRLCSNSRVLSSDCSNLIKNYQLDLQSFGKFLTCLLDEFKNYTCNDKQGY